MTQLIIAREEEAIRSADKTCERVAM